jgi:hypothetical protein
VDTCAGNGVGVADILASDGVSIGVAIGRPEDADSVRRYTFDEWRTFIKGAKNDEFDDFT